MRIYLVFILFAVLELQNLRAVSQLSEPGTPAGFIKNLPGIEQFVILPHIDLAKLSCEDRIKNNVKPFRYAAVIDTRIDMTNSGKWVNLPDGSGIWRVGIVSAGAYSLSVVFHGYCIPEGAKVFLYNPRMTQVLGAFTSKNNKPGKILPTAPVEGDTMVIEYDRPAGADDSANLLVAQVCHDYKGLFSRNYKDGNFGHSGSCNVDINCNQGVDWQREKHAVCRIITGGTLCTGTLVNNTANDGKPYFLTAHHCLSTQAAASNMVLFFNYESPYCHGPDGSTNQTVAGSTIKATTPYLDFCLVELSETPPASYQPYYAGWSTSDYPAKRSVCIHHPQGDVKKISKDYDPPVTGNYGAAFDPDSHWQIIVWDLATTEGGSSGCPLFDNQHRLTGDLTGGEATCANPVNDYFAKFSRSWDDYAGQDQQLKFWLDPDNTGDTAINGYDPWYGNNLPVANFNAVPTVIMAGGSVDFSDLSVGNVTSWSWSFPGAETTGSGLQYPSGITYNTPGAYEVSLTVSNGYGSDTELKTSYILVAEGCEKKSNIGQSESLALYSFSGGEWGYWSGHNQHIFTEFAERYNNLPGHFVHGIYILPGKAYNASVNSKITIKIWEGGALPGNEIYSKDILISQLNAGVSTYIPFVPTVGTSGSFYAGYQVYYNLADTFATLHAEPRGAGGLNTYYVKMDNTWHPVIDFSQTFTTSLSVEPKVCGLEEINSTNNTNHVIIFPNPSDGIFNINIGDDIRVINNVQVYNILGKIVANIGKDDINSGLVKVELNNPAEGIYLVRIPFENGIVEKKILIIR